MSVSSGQVRQVMRASVWARRVCTFLLVVCAVISVCAFVSIMNMDGFGKSRVWIGYYTFPGTALESGSFRAWVGFIIVVAVGLGLAFLYLLRAVFVNLARGDIFCAANVRHIRHLGYLVIAGGVFEWFVNLANGAYWVLAEKNNGMQHTHLGFGAFGSITYGALLILLSWIMAVGLGVREDAEELRRDAELVI